jgi:4'-phosphopantetheinyl transferase
MGAVSEPRVEVWWAPSRPGAGLALTADERRRADARARPDEAASSAVLARLAVGHVLGVDPVDVTVGRRCPTCASDAHGVPTVVGADLSITRTSGLVAVAVSLVGAVGLDVEERRERLFDGFDDVALSPLETVETVEDRLRTWARKEALLKACGLGLSVDPRTVVLDGRRVVSAPAQVGRLDLHDLDLAGHVGALALPVGAGFVVRPTTLSA